MLQTNVRHDLTRTFYQAMQATTLEDLEGIFGQLEEQGRQILRGEEVPDEQVGFLRTADMRYIGQEYSVNGPTSFEDAVGARGDQSPNTGTRDVIFHGTAVPTKFYRRDRLPTGIALAGPHVIEEETATTVVPPGWISRVDALGNIIITRKES